MVPDVSRITALTELLGDPQLAYPTVHVTGTNGKGSVVRMVGALCSAAGLAAGTYTYTVNGPGGIQEICAFEVGRSGNGGCNAQDLKLAGFTTAEIPVEHHRRTHGVSKYGWKRLFKGALDLITVVVLTRYLKRPGHFFGGLGLLSGMLGFLILASLTIEKFVFGHSIGQRPLLLLGVLLIILGVQLVSTGLIGEMINFHSDTRASRNKPTLEERL